MQTAAGASEQFAQQRICVQHKHDTGSRNSDVAAVTWRPRHDRAMRGEVGRTGPSALDLLHQQPICMSLGEK